MRETDLQKYPWITSFLMEDINDFKGAYNIDLGTMQFSYTVTKGNKDSILNKMDSIAKNESWSLVRSSVNGREYSKTLSQYSADAEHVIIKIGIDTIEKRIHFNIK